MFSDQHGTEQCRKYWKQGLNMVINSICWHLKFRIRSSATSVHEGGAYVVGLADGDFFALVLHRVEGRA